MLYIDTQDLSSVIAANEKLSVGMEFLRLIRRESFATIEQGIVPTIAGGAVRDGLFPHKTNHEVNDIDIFFHRATTEHTSHFGDGRATRAEQQIYDINLQRLRENVMVWLEDNDIPFESLLSEQAAEYFGSQRFLDIISFVWQGVTIQMMIPSNYLSLCSSSKSFLTTMPVISGACLSLDRLTMTPAFVAAINAPQGVSLSGMDVDLPYIRRKFPDNQVVFFTTQGMMIGYTLQAYFRSITASAIAGRTANENPITAANSGAQIALRAAADFLGLAPQQITFNNTRPVDIS